MRLAKKWIIQILKNNNTPWRILGECNFRKTSTNNFKGWTTITSGFLNYFDDVKIHLSQHRKYKIDGDFEIITEYMASPDITNKSVILCDPMLAVVCP